MSLDAFSAKFTRDIKAYGWTIVSVFADADHGVPSFSYTTGLSASGHGELLVLGLSSEVAHQILNTIAEKIINKQLSGVHMETIVGVANASLRLKTSGCEGELFVKYAAEFAAKNALPLSVFQVEYPDVNGRFPDDPACEPTITALQDLKVLGMVRNEDSKDWPGLRQSMH